MTLISFAGSPHGGSHKLLPEWQSQSRITPVLIIDHSIVGSALGAELVAAGGDAALPARGGAHQPVRSRPRGRVLRDRCRRGRRPPVRPRLHRPSRGGRAAVAFALLVPAAGRAGAALVPHELVPQQLARIQSQRHPGDVVLVSALASFQYAYYAPDRPTFVATPPRWAAVPFMVTYPGRRDVVVVGGLDDAAIRHALADAASRTTRIWVVLGHSEPGRGEEARWDAAARSIGRVTKVRTAIVERFGPRQAELERPWLVEVGRQARPG